MADSESPLGRLFNQGPYGNEIESHDRDQYMDEEYADMDDDMDANLSPGGMLQMTSPLYRLLSRLYGGNYESPEGISPEASPMASPPPRKKRRFGFGSRK